MVLGALLAILLALPAAAQEAGQSNLGCFLGMNDADTPATLPKCESPALLNTESNLDGSAILKRKGFAKVADLAVTTSPVSGSHSFIDSSGNRKDIVCQDRNCSASTNGNAFTQFYSSGGLNGGTSGAIPTRWSWVDVGGVAYGANNRRDPILYYNGTSTASPAGMPTGSILELTQDRLAIGDITSQPNRVHYSSAGAYDQFTVGVNPEDSFFDDFGAAGDRIRGIKCIEGTCFIFKTASITSCEMDDQYNTQCSVISGNIGTTDPASIVTAGSSLYFRAQDKNYWEIDSSGLVQISKKIPNLVASQSGGLGGGENSNTQTTQADWQAGDQTPDLSWNTTTENGSIFPSSITLVDSSSSNFAAGTIPASMTTGVVQGSLRLSTAAYIVYNGDFESGTCAAGTYWTCSTISNATCGWDSTYAIGGSCGGRAVTAGCSVPSNSGYAIVSIRSADDTAELYSKSDATDNTILSGGSIDLVSLGLSTQTVRIRFYAGWSGFLLGACNPREAQMTSSTFTALSVSWQSVAGTGFGFGWSQLDDIKADRYFSIYQDSATPSYFLSRVFDTAFSTPIGGPFVPSISTEIANGISFNIRSSADGSTGWTSFVAVSSGDRITQSNRYQQYGSTFTTSVATATPSLLDASLPYATTGQFVTQCIEPNASISAWGTLSCAETKAGSGSIVYYATSAVSCATLPVSTAPVNSFGAAQAGWTAQTNNATVTIATNSAVYIGWRSLLVSATDQAQVDACVLSWNEGTPSQPSWAVYDSIKNAVYWTATIDGAAATNRLLKYDRNLLQWYPFDISAQAPKVINNTLYFGGAAAGTWNSYGLVDADAGSAIDAYWTSKDMGGDRPFLEKDFKTLSILSRNNGSGTMTGTWTNSIGNTGDYTISLSTGSGITYARSNYNLPKKSPQQFMKVRVGNNSSTPFEVLGIGLTWQVLPWRVAP